jgi:hypothetical protein
METTQPIILDMFYLLMYHFLSGFEYVTSSQKFCYAMYNILGENTVYVHLNFSLFIFNSISHK